MLNEIKKSLKEFGIAPKKSLGQNFLIDDKILKKIIDAAQIHPNDIVLEIGPGLGILTKELAKRAKKVIAVEKDEKMCEILKKNMRNYENLEIINDDVLKLGNFEIKKLIVNCKLKIENYKIVANIPYYLTSKLIRMFLESPNPPSDLVLMVQKEVAQRICAKPPKMNLLAVSAQFYAEPKIISYVSKNCFWPSPKIDSAIIKIIPKDYGSPTSPKFDQSRALLKLFFRAVKAGFSHPRKTLANNLSKELKLKKQEVEKILLENNIKKNERPSFLTIEDWIKISKAIDIKF